MLLPDLPPVARWGVCVLDASTGEVLAAHRQDDVHRTASVGKLLLLWVIARGLEDHELDGAELLSRAAVAPVADSGLWQHLAVDVLPLVDVAALVASVSDNLATNVLLERVGLAAVERAGRDLGLVHTALRDLVRDHRCAEHPPTLSTGTAAELAALVLRLPPRVLSWLALGTDLSMVASAFGVDPLAHVAADRGLRVLSKTGTDDGVRADVGLVEGPAGAVSYAVLAEWDPAVDARDEVLATMRAIGLRLRDRVTGSA